MVATIDYSTARQNMIDGQVRPNGIIDQRLLDAMADIPREIFLPQNLRSVAYIDEDLDLGQGRYLIEPVVTARMLQALSLKESDVVLEIGAGVGYGTALLARLVNTVVAVESDDALIERSQAALGELGVDNTVTISGELTAGYADQAPFDAIVINGAVSEIPEAITSQLADEGRLVTVVRPSRSMGAITLIKRVRGVSSDVTLYDAGTPFLAGFEAKPAFQF